jgi:hypothetical protein
MPPNPKILEPASRRDREIGRAGWSQDATHPRCRFEQVDTRGVCFPLGASRRVLGTPRIRVPQLLLFLLSLCSWLSHHFYLFTFLPPFLSFHPSIHPSIYFSLSLSSSLFHSQSPLLNGCATFQCGQNQVSSFDSLEALAMCPNVRFFLSPPSISWV